MNPYYEADGITIYHGDALEVLESLPAVGAVVSDPPYPNNAGHFVDGIAAAEEFCRTFLCEEWLVFWDELTRPPVPLPLVAVHVWHRTNSNRPDNYEPVYHFTAAGAHKASRCFGYPVVYPGLTGCKEATGHPTQKSERLMQRLVGMTAGTVLDPFMGSGTTLVAAKNLGRKAIGIEVEERYCETAAKRLAQGVLDLGGVA